MDVDNFDYFIGVDVGTSSVRAALVSRNGHITCTATQSLQIWQPRCGYYQQSSDDIWHSCCIVVKKVMHDVNPICVGGIGFAATCSMVVLDEAFRPVSISPDGNSDCNVIMWLDHRAAKEAEIIESTKHRLLNYLGGKMSPEMQAPKLLWLKKNLPEQCWNMAAHFFDLPDFLSFRATGCLTRSLCCLGCKWNYEYNGVQGNLMSGWLDDYWSDIGLKDFVNEKYKRIGGDNIALPGSPIGQGLSHVAASELGLCASTAVGASLIDAYAGCLGIAGIDVSSVGMKNVDIISRLSLICGTSTCHMKVTEQPLYVPGVWGPFNSVMLPGLCLNEGGQSATGKLVDHIIYEHPYFLTLQETSNQKDDSVHNLLNQYIMEKSNMGGHWAYLTKNLHILPDYHGNRSPLANYNLKGMNCGLTLASDLDDLARKYLATLQALAYGTKHIIEVMQQHGHNVEIILACGGLSKNDLFLKSHADITGLPIVLGKEEESVLLGASMLGISAALPKCDLKAVMTKLSAPGIVVQPSIDKQLNEYHRRKYQIFLEMQQNQLRYNRTMDNVFI